MLHFTWKNSTITLDEKNGHATFDLGIPAESATKLEALSITRNEFYDFYGQPSEFSPAEVQTFLEGLGETINLDVAAHIAALIQKIIVDVLVAFNQEAAWVSLRASTPNPAFDIPRYHFDGYFFMNAKETPQAKFLCTLKGPGTIFHPLVPEDRATFNLMFNNQCKHAMEYPTNPSKFYTDRKELQKLIQKADEQHGSKDLHMETREGGIFLVGGENTAAIHSEPPISSQRLFFSIVPGSTKNIAAMRNRISM